MCGLSLGPGSKEGEVILCSTFYMEITINKRLGVKYRK